MPFTVKKVTPIQTDSLEDLGDSVRDLAAWAEDEFGSVASAMQSTEPDTIWHSAPPKPRTGTTVYADGTNWNPGAGPGTYFYDGTSWVTTNASGKVSKSGDTMTGNLTITKSGPTVLLNKTDAVDATVRGQKSGLDRWVLDLGNGAVEGGGNSGSNFAINRYDDAGTIIGTSLAIVRSGDAPWTINGDVNVIRPSSPTTGVVYFGNTGLNYLYWSGVDYALAGGGLNVAAAIRAQGGTVYVRQAGGGGNIHLWYENSGGASYSILYHEVATNHFHLTNSQTGKDFICKNDGNFQAPQGYQCKAGYSGGYGTNGFNLFYNAGPCQLWIDATNLGNISVVSDYRTKENDVILPSMWEIVKSLRPIEYNHKDFTPPSEMKEGKAPTEPFFKGDPVRRWGFVAHELQETLIPSAATAYKDVPNAIQAPDAFTVIAALTRALQEAMTRIEVLEARK